MELRPVRPDDAPWIGDDHHHCWLAGYTGIVDQHVLDGLRAVDRIERWTTTLRDEPDAPLIVAVVEGVPVGHVRVDGDTITNVYVDPRHWRRGFGRILLAAGEEMLRTTGHDQGVLWTFVGNDRAIAMYRASGWTPDGTVEEHDTFAGVAAEELRLTKHLTDEAQSVDLGTPESGHGFRR